MSETLYLTKKEFESCGRILLPLAALPRGSRIEHPSHKSLIFLGVMQDGKVRVKKLQPDDPVPECNHSWEEDWVDGIGWRCDNCNTVVDDGDSPIW